MLATAESILEHGRSLEVDSSLLPVKRILTLINENPLNPEAASKSGSSTTATASGDAAAHAKTKKVDPVAAFEHFKSLGVSAFFGVPDSLLAPFCQVVTERAQRHLITANEGSAVATAAGHHFATGEVRLPVFVFVCLFVCLFVCVCVCVCYCLTLTLSRLLNSVLLIHRCRWSISRTLGWATLSIPSCLWPMLMCMDARW